MTERFKTYEAFWPFYVSQHLHPVNRRLHFVGTACVVTLLTLGVTLRPMLLLALPIVGYGFAWIGHFRFEKNRPATFTYPLWSLRGDFRMFRLMLLGRMAPEIARARSAFASNVHN
jgi:hypothetical protein